LTMKPDISFEPMPSLHRPQALLYHRAIGAQLALGAWQNPYHPGLDWARNRGVQVARYDISIALDVGTATCGGGDIEFFYRAVAGGYALQYEPMAVVWHTHRRDQASFRRQIYNNGRSFAAYLMTISRNEPQRRRAILWFGTRWWLWNWLIARIFVSFGKRDWWTLRLALTEFRGACSAPKAYRTAQLIAAQQLRA
jgi:hypothetical protein